MRILRISHSAVVDAWRERERELRRIGFEVTLLSARSWDEAGAIVELRPRPGEDVQGVRTFGTHPALFGYDPRPLWRALGEQWDVIDIHEEPFALATAEVLALRALRRLVQRAPREPFVVYSAQNIFKKYPWPFGALERRVLRRAAAISVCNAEAGRIARRKGLRGHVAVIPLGIDPASFAAAEPPGPPRHAESPGTRPIRVGYAGRLAEHKGVRTLLDAVSSDEALQLEIAGDGPLATELRDRARPLGSRVRFHGSVSQDDLPGFYRSVDVLAVPSLATPGWVEQFGRVAVEAMACGTPVVASDTGALPDVVGGAGLLVPAADAGLLRDALVRVGTDHELAGRLRAAGLARAQECTWAQVAQSYATLYRQVVAGVPAPDLPAMSATAGDPEPPEVIVVAYGSPDLVRSALEPLAGAFALTVVDNSSSPQVRSVAESVSARYFDTGANLGFAAGVNRGLAERLSPGADVLLLNPDAVISPAGVLELQRALHSDDRLASVGPEQVDGDGHVARVVWPFPSPLGTVLEAVGLGRLRRREDFVIGSVLLLRAEAVADVGGLDERFFLYAEETDWAYRAHQRGWQHRVVPGVAAMHLSGATSSDPTVRERHFHASQERYIRKHYGPVGWQVARVATIAGAAIRSVVLPGERGAAAARRLRVYARGPVRAEGARP